jgi:hypothetical protein
MTLIGALEQQAEAMERDAAAMRKLMEAARDLGEERVAALLAPMVARGANGHAGTGNGHTNGEAVPTLAVVSDPVETADEEPRGRQAVRMIVHERPGVWTLADLHAEMKRRGWFTSNKAVDVAVTRLVRSQEARHVGLGRYEFLAPNESRML